MEEQVEYSCSNCSHSGADRDHFTEINDLLYCEDCGNTCSRCESIVGQDGYWIDDTQESWCTDCRSYYSNYCEGCERQLSDDVTFREVLGYSNYQCENCCENNFNWCSECSNYYDDECDCLSDDINDYNFKPEWIMRGGGSLFFGIEIETEIRDHNISEASNRIHNYKLDDLLILKHDSTIGNNTIYKGFEIVSHPISHDYWRSDDQDISISSDIFKYIEDIRTNHQARSWDTESCGLHIHISRTGFRSGAHTHRFLSFVYRNSEIMMRFAGRKSTYAKFSDAWAYDKYDRPYLNFKDKIHNGHNTDRYSAVNTRNDDTIELRFFRGTMKKSGILSALDLSHAMVEYTRNLTVSEVRAGAYSWDKFAQYVRDHSSIYPDLVQRLDKVKSDPIDTVPAQQA